MNTDALITVGIFVLVYVCISFEWLNKAIAALFGVMRIIFRSISLPNPLNSPTHSCRSSGSTENRETSWNRILHSI